MSGLFDPWESMMLVEHRPRITQGNLWWWADCSCGWSSPSCNTVKQAQAELVAHRKNTPLPRGVSVGEEET